MIKTRTLILLGSLVMLGGLAAAVALMTGPYMVEQPSVRPYEARMPMPPAGTVPVKPPPALPTAEQARELRNPILPTEQNVARGKVYYQYYCVFCHAANGDGNAAVGQSLVPVPTDLRSPKVQAYSDGELLRAMLTGPGHKPFAPYAGPVPVLEYTVLPEHRWYLVLFVRSLAPSPTPPTRQP
jgi:hypothetical protein